MQVLRSYTVRYEMTGVQARAGVEANLGYQRDTAKRCIDALIHRDSIHR